MNAVRTGSKAQRGGSEDSEIGRDGDEGWARNYPAQPHPKR